MAYATPEGNAAYHAHYRAANREKLREKQRAYVAANPEKKRASDAAWAAANPEKVRAESAKRRAANPEKARAANAKYRAANPEKVWAAVLKYEYGITPQEHDALRLQQDNKCAICSSPFDKTPHTDHCHVTLKVRGLLCGACNKSLGLMLDDPTRLRAAAAYLELHRAT